MTLEVAPRVPHFVNWLPLLFLLVTGVANAQQPRPPLALRQKSVTLPAGPQAALVRVARGILTTLTFDSALASKGVQLAGRNTHFEQVFEGERLVAFKPKVELKPDERMLLSVRFADGAAPQEATFELVAASEEVDASVEVVRRARNVEDLETALANTQAQLTALQARCGDGGPESAVLAGWLTWELRARSFNAKMPPDNASGLRVGSGAGYRSPKWALVVIQLYNGLGSQRWTPGEVRLMSVSGVAIKILSTRLEKPHLDPGEKGQLLVRTEAPWWMRDEELRMELRDKEGGRPLPLSGVRF